MYTVLDQIFLFFSFIGNYSLVWIVIMLALILFEEIKHKKFAPVFVFTLAATWTVTQTIKFLFQTSRPGSGMIKAFICPTDYSFPSGHAATSFAAALILSHFDPKRKVIYYATAVLISYSRIYLHCHYPLDVAGGMILGTIIALGVLKTDKKTT